MQRSEGRIRVSHAGVLPRPDDLQQLLLAGEGSRAAFDARLESAVAEVVRHQADIGIDVVNDGEVAKRGGFSGYVRERLSGIEQRPLPDGLRTRSPNLRDQRDFPGFYAAGLGGVGRGVNANRASTNNDPYFCTAPLAYIGAEAVQADIARLQQATAGLDVEAYLPAITPGTVEHWLFNEHYPDDEALLCAIAEAMREEYLAITDAGLILQLDDPDLPDGWQMYPEMTVAEYRDYATLRVEALLHALRGIPEEKVRLHVCWGSQHGPHRDDIALRDIIDIVLRVPAQCLSVEAANPTHEHEWRLWEEVKLPEGRILMPGAVGHASDLIEHPELVCQRLLRFAGLLGRENVIAGTDCGLAARVGHPEITWAKLEALAAGARLASEALW